MTIIGIDPGLASTGYGIIRYLPDKKTKEKAFQCLEYGLIETEPSLPIQKRLEKLYRFLVLLLKKHSPDLMAIETVYFFKNLKTVIPVSQARGIVLLAAAGKNLDIKEITPLQVKMAITGYGSAEKPQIQETVKLLLNLKEIPRPDDVGDALAVAICATNEKKKIG